MYFVHRSYHNPRPERQAILNSASRFREAVDSSLRLGSIRCYKFNVEFRLDVFSYLFNSDSGCKYYEDDFPEDHFPTGWSVVYDRLGDGCRIDFPVEMKPALKWSGLCFNKSDDGTLVPRPKYFNEVVSVKLDKCHC